MKKNPKPVNILVVEEIITAMKQGKLFKDVVDLAKTKHGITRRTFQRLWTEASVIWAERRAKIEERLIELDAQAALKDRQRQIMSASERKEYLSQLIQKPIKVRKVGGKIEMVHEYLDDDGVLQSEILNNEIKLKAMSELNRMCGDYAPTKVEQTGSMVINVVGRRAGN